MRGILYDYVLDPLKSFRVDSLLPFPLSSLHLSKVVLLQHPVLDYYSMEVDVLQKKPKQMFTGNVDSDSILLLYSKNAFGALTTGVQGWVLPSLDWSHLPSDFHARCIFGCI